ncbi:MAG: amidohydrolase [Acidimicrobiaceae bacterium]|nr:amidohydrolase [Acidimicrobiaceae bacterium]
MTRIDLHCHVFPPGYRNQLSGGLAPPPVHDELLAYMDAWRTDAAVLSSGGPLRGSHPLPQLARLINEGYAQLVAEHPKRFGAIASVPLPDVDAALVELEYALDTLHLDGVLLLTNYQGVYLGDPRLDPFFDELERRATYCFVHPDFPPTSPLPEHPGRWYEFPFDTTRALVNVALTGTFDRCPNVKLQWAHLGGTIPFIANRIHAQSSRMPDETARMRLGMADYVARQFYDTGLSAYYGNLISTLGVVGMERIVFGTDWPYISLPGDGDDPQPELALLGHARPKIDHENAAALVPRLVERMTAGGRVAR